MLMEANLSYKAFQSTAECAVFVENNISHSKLDSRQRIKKFYEPYHLHFIQKILVNFEYLIANICS